MNAARGIGGGGAATISASALKEKEEDMLLEEDVAVVIEENVPAAQAPNAAAFPPVHRLTLLPYGSLKDKQLREQLGKLGGSKKVSTVGNHEALAWRHRTYTNLHNSAVDRLLAKRAAFAQGNSPYTPGELEKIDVAALVRELEAAEHEREESQRKVAMVSRAPPQLQQFILAANKVREEGGPTHTHTSSTSAVISGPASSLTRTPGDFLERHKALIAAPHLASLREKARRMQKGDHHVGNYKKRRRSEENLIEEGIDCAHEEVDEGSLKSPLTFPTPTSSSSVSNSLPTAPPQVPTSSSSSSRAASTPSTIPSSSQIAPLHQTQTLSRGPPKNLPSFVRCVHSDKANCYFYFNLQSGKGSFALSDVWVAEPQYETSSAAVIPTGSRSTTTHSDDLQPPNPLPSERITEAKALEVAAPAISQPSFPHHQANLSGEGGSGGDSGSTTTVVPHNTRKTRKVAGGGGESGSGAISVGEDRGSSGATAAAVDHTQAAASSAANWSCSRCTYINPNTLKVCKMCQNKKGRRGSQI